jgi:hypothetical protein
MGKLHNLTSQLTSMRILLLTLIISVNAIAQTTWAPPKASWRYFKQSLGFNSEIKITSIDSIIPGTNIQVLKQVDSTNYYNTQIIKITTSYLYTYSIDNKVYLGKSQDQMSLYYEFGIPIAQKAGSYYVDSIFTVQTECGSTSGYRAALLGKCKPKLDYGLCIERLGNLKWMFFQEAEDCFSGESYWDLREYSDGSGFHYTSGSKGKNAKFECTTTFLEPEQKEASTFITSPNPSSAQTTFETSNLSELQYQIVNMDGITVLSGSFIQKLTFELPQQGLYIVRVLDNQKLVYTGKVIKN